MARACLRRGAAWAVVSDHTRGLACVNGLDAEGIELQRRAVASWNHRRGEELWLVQGLEVEILEDGRLDVPRTAREGVLLVAAVHTGLAERRDQTGRLLRALQEPGVWALAHPRGRLFARRSGIRANWEVVFAEAAAGGILLEVNGFPRRQDLDPTLLALAHGVGCRFLLASDAHHPRHLAFDATAVALCAQAAIPHEAIVNFEPIDHLASDRPDLAMP
jgi:DNA polymerase (family 10)